MIEKLTPLTVIMTVWVGWLMYASTVDYRTYRFNTMVYLYPTDNHVRKIEVGKLGKMYRYKEHLTKSMYE